MKYLVPTDYSANAQDALQYALDMARLSNAEVHVLSVLSFPPSTAGTTGSLAIRMKEDAQAKMEEVLKFCEEQSFEVHPSIREGGVVPTVLNMVEEVEPDLIIMGTKGSSSIDSVVLGSVASKIIQKSPVPVLAIPNGSKFEGLTKITYASDLQKGGPIIANKILDLTEGFKSRVDVVHIFPVKAAPPYIQLDLLRKEIKADERERKVKYHLHRNDDIQEGLMNFMDASESQLLAMVTKKRNLFRKFIDPSLTRRVAMDVHMPLLTFQVVE